MNAQQQTTADELARMLENQKQVIASLRGERDRMADALGHVANVCDGSRTSTRRLRWIALRARCAIRGDDDGWRNADLPVVDPLVDKLRELLRTIFPIVSRELVGLIDSYSTLSEEERKRATFDAILESIHDPDGEAGVAADCKAMREFLQGTRRNVPEINIEQLRAGGDWIELT